MTGEVPLAELSGYSTHLRTVTSGRASISMQLSHYQVSHGVKLLSAPSNLVILWRKEFLELDNRKV